MWIRIENSEKQLNKYGKQTNCEESIGYSDSIRFLVGVARGRQGSH